MGEKQRLDEEKNRKERDLENSMLLCSQTMKFCESNVEGEYSRFISVFSFRKAESSRANGALGGSKSIISSDAWSLVSAGTKGKTEGRCKTQEIRKEG